MFLCLFVSLYAPPTLLTGVVGCLPGEEKGPYQFVLMQDWCLATFEDVWRLTGRAKCMYIYIYIWSPPPEPTTQNNIYIYMCIYNYN